MQPTRRVVLLGAGATAVAACTPNRPPRPAAPTVEETARAAAVTREQALVDAYQAAIREHPALASRLTSVLGDHVAHLAALAPDGGPTRTATPSAPAKQRSTRGTLASLATLEREAATSYAAAAATVETAATCDRVLAPLLASLAASEASHAVVLAP